MRLDNDTLPVEATQPYFAPYEPTVLSLDPLAIGKDPSLHHTSYSTTVRVTLSSNTSLGHLRLSSAQLCVDSTSSM